MCLEMDLLSFLGRGQEPNTYLLTQCFSVSATLQCCPHILRVAEIEKKKAPILSLLSSIVLLDWWDMILEGRKKEREKKVMHIQRIICNEFSFEFSSMLEG